MANNYKIAVLPGDGTGPEVVEQGVKVLKAASSKFGFSLDLKEFDWVRGTGTSKPEMFFLMMLPSSLRDLIQFTSVLSGILM